MSSFNLAALLGVALSGQRLVQRPANTAAPVVSGSAPVGSTLSTTNGTWSGSPTSYAYQWTRDGAAIGGATASTYTTVPADDAHAIGCTVTATNAGGSASAASNTIAATAVLLAWDYTGQTPGAAGTASPLVYARASTATAEDRVAGTTQTGIANNTPTCHRTANSVVGLGNYPARTNLQLRSRDPTSSPWVSGVVTLTHPYGTAPDGTTTNATRCQAAAGSNFRSQAIGVTSGLKYTYSAWLAAATVGVALDLVIGGVGTGVGTGSASAPDTAWRRYALTVTPTSTGNITIFAVDTRAAFPGTAPAGARDQVYDLGQLEQGAYATPPIPTTGASATRAGGNWTTPPGTPVVSSGRVTMAIELEVPCTLASNDSAMRLWSDPNDATSFVELATGGTLTVSIGGATNTCAVSGFAAGSYVKLFVAAGGSQATVVKYQVDSGAVQVPAITGSALGTFAPSGVLEVCCSSTAKQLAGVIAKGTLYASGCAPAWAA